MFVWPDTHWVYTQVVPQIARSPEALSGFPIQDWPGAAGMVQRVPVIPDNAIKKIPFWVISAD